MKNLNLKMLVFAVMMFVGCTAANAKTSIIFTYYNNGYVTPPGGGSVCSASVSVSWTTLVGGAPVSHTLAHTFTTLGEVYLFALGNDPTIGNINYLFSVPCRSLLYGSYSKAAADAGFSSSPDYPSASVPIYLFVEPTTGPGVYNFFFENPDGI